MHSVESHVVAFAKWYDDGPVLKIVHSSRDHVLRREWLLSPLVLEVETMRWRVRLDGFLLLKHDTDLLIVRTAEVFRARRIYLHSWCSSDWFHSVLDNVLVWNLVGI